MISNGPFTSSVKPATIDLTKSADILLFQSSAKEGRILIFPKGYVPETKENRFVKSPFTSHQLKPKSLSAIERIPGEGWVFLALVLVFILLLWLRRINPKKLFTYLSAFYNRRSVNELFDEENILSSSYSLILFIAFCLTGSLFIIKASGIAGMEILEQYSPIKSFGVFAGVLFVVYTFKIFFIQVIGNVFRQSTIAKQYAFNVYLLNNILGLILVPLVAIAYYSGAPTDLWAIYAGTALFIVFFALRFLKSLSIEGVATPINIMYLFLYLCTLEILPLLVAIKLVIVYL